MAEEAEEPLRTAVAKLAEAALKQRWSPLAKKPIRAATLTSLLALYFDHSPAPAAVVDKVVGIHMEDLLADAVWGVVGGEGFRCEWLA